MSNKNRNPAIIKRDTVENWAKSSYVPAENVIIIMDDEEHNTIRLMIGDGETNVNKLPDIINNTKRMNKPPKSPTVNEDKTLIL